MITTTISDLSLGSISSQAHTGSGRARRLYPVVGVLMGRAPFVVGYAGSMDEAAKIGRENRLGFSEVFTGTQRRTNRRFFGLRP